MEKEQSGIDFAAEEQRLADIAKEIADLRLISAKFDQEYGFNQQEQ